MISLSQFKVHMLAFVRLMITTDMGYIDVAYKGRGYRLHLEDLNVNVKHKGRPPARKLVELVEEDKCPTCKKLMLNNVCMSSICPAKLPR